ncbi:MAG: hypothetical protein CMO01_23055 [Thalassobius sp.]|nr:hypothetical protein [Thalassovita sp.]
MLSNKNLIMKFIRIYGAVQIFIYFYGSLNLSILNNEKVVFLTRARKGHLPLKMPFFFQHRLLLQ